MNIHEYQAKAAAAQLPASRRRAGEVVYTSKAAARVAEELGGQRVGREGPDPRGRPRQGRRREARQHAREDRRARRPDARLHARHRRRPDRRASASAGVLVERASRIEREFYLSLFVDRDSQRIVVIASAEGGVDIEEVAARDPDAIHTEYVDPGVGLLDFQCRKVATAIGLANRTTSFTRLLKRMYRLFRDTRLPAARGQPVHRDRGRRARRARRKMSFDDNALFRQGDVVELRDFDEEDPKEVEAIGPRPELHRARRQRRLHRERRRPRDGHDGRDRAPRRPPRELPRRGRRREPREDRERVPHRAEGPERAGDPREHLRRASTGATGSRRASCRPRATRRSTCR